MIGEQVIDSIVLTTERPIHAPSKESIDKIFAKKKVGKKLRHFEFRFANPKMWKLAQFMEKVDLWRHSDGYPSKSMFEVGTIKTYSMIRTEDYQKLVAYAIEETGGKLFSFVEVIDPNE